MESIDRNKPKNRVALRCIIKKVREVKWADQNKKYKKYKFSIM